MRSASAAGNPGCVRAERRQHLCVRVEQCVDDVGPDLVPHPGGRRGHQPLDVELVRVDEEPHHRHLVVRLVGDVGHHDDPGFLHVRIDACRYGIERRRTLCLDRLEQADEDECRRCQGQANAHTM